MEGPRDKREWMVEEDPIKHPDEQPEEGKGGQISGFAWESLGLWG